jgi:hypothetical protein
MKIGDKYRYMGKDYAVEQIDPDKTRWDRFFEWFSDQKHNPMVVFQEVDKPYCRLIVNKYGTVIGDFKKYFIEII